MSRERRRSARSASSSAVTCSRSAARRWSASARAEPSTAGILERRVVGVALRRAISSASCRASAASPASAAATAPPPSRSTSSRSAAASASYRARTRRSASRPPPPPPPFLLDVHQLHRFLGGRRNADRLVARIGALDCLASSASAAASASSRSASTAACAALVRQRGVGVGGRRRERLGRRRARLRDRHELHRRLGLGGARANRLGAGGRALLMLLGLRSRRVDVHRQLVHRRLEGFRRPARGLEVLAQPHDALDRRRLDLLERVFDRRVAAALALHPVGQLQDLGERGRLWWWRRRRRRDRALAVRVVPERGAAGAGWRGAHRQLVGRSAKLLAQPCDLRDARHVLLPRRADGGATHGAVLRRHGPALS